MNNKNLQNALKNLAINHVLGMSGLMFIQPNIDLITEEDIFKAEEIVSDLATKINWGFDIKENAQNKSILNKAEKLTAKEQEEYFKKIFKRFNIEYNN